MDMDGTPKEIWEQGAQLARDTIEMWLPYTDELVCWCVYDNHGGTHTRALKTALKWAYEGHSKVRVIDRGESYVYYRYGNTILGATHGDNLRTSRDLHIKMSEDCREWWSEAKYGIWFLGHDHKLEVEESGSVEVHRAPTVSGPNRWVAKKGFIENTPRLMAWKIDYELGLTGTFRATLDPTEGVGNGKRS
jgi:hypothetical protein